MGRKQKPHEAQHKVSTSKLDGVMTADAALLQAGTGEGKSWHGSSLVVLFITVNSE